MKTIIASAVLCLSYSTFAANITPISKAFEAIGHLKGGLPAGMKPANLKGLSIDKTGAREAILFSVATKGEPIFATASVKDYNHLSELTVFFYQKMTPAQCELLNVPGFGQSQIDAITMGTGRELTGANFKFHGLIRNKFNVQMAEETALLDSAMNARLASGMSPDTVFQSKTGSYSIVRGKPGIGDAVGIPVKFTISKNMSPEQLSVFLETIQEAAEAGVKW